MSGSFKNEKDESMEKESSSNQMFNRKEESIQEIYESDIAATSITSESNQNYTSIDEQLNSTSLTEGIYRTPLTSPDVWGHEDADELHEALNKINFGESPIKKFDENVHWLSAEKSTEENWSRSPLISEIERCVAEESSQIEYSETVVRPTNRQGIHGESTTYYDHLASELLMSVVESHRDSMNEQKLVLANLTKAINRLTEAIEQQTKIIGISLSLELKK